MRNEHTWFGCVIALAAALELSGRIPLAAAAPYQVAPALGVGMVFNSGAQWLDRDNFAYNGVRVSPAPRIGAAIGRNRRRPRGVDVAGGCSRFARRRLPLSAVAGRGGRAVPGTGDLRRPDGSGRCGRPQAAARRVADAVRIRRSARDWLQLLLI